MKMLMCGVALAVLAGCTTAGGDEFFISPHGYAGEIRATVRSLDGRGVPTILQAGEAPLQALRNADGSAVDMHGTYRADATGNVEATGFPAYIMALAALCRAAENARACLEADFGG